MNLREAAKQALEALEKYDAYDRNGVPQTWFDFVDKPAITDLRDALYEDAMQRFTDVQQQMERRADTGKTSDHFPGVRKMVGAWTQAHWTEYERGLVAVERENIAQWVEDMCADLDAKTIANGIRNGGNDDIGAFEVRK